MNESLNRVLEKRCERTVKALCENNFDAVFVKTREEGLKAVEGILKPGTTVSSGGSVTLQECNIIDLLRSGAYTYLDREKAKFPEETLELYRKTFFADFYLTSSNAITETGLLYNVDGNANRVAAMLFGPKEVLVIAGYNKIVADEVEADRRLRNIAAPANAMRLGYQTPCTKTGYCMDCDAPQRICRNYVTMGRQKDSSRIHVILVGESLGL